MKFFLITYLLLCSLSVQAKYLIVVDAGSSGSREYIYYYDQAKGNGLNSVKEVAKLKVEPGMSVIASSRDPKVLENYLQPMARFALENIPSAEQKQTTLTWYATAGMRLISPVRQAKTYLAIQNWFTTKTPFKIRDIKTIPGQQEGAFMWLSSNYTTHSLLDRTPHAILDMGGASTQIVFNRTDQKQANVTVKLNDKSYYLFSHSFLGLGRNEARNQFANTAACFAKNYPLPNGHLGVGNLAACQRQIKVFLQARYQIEKFVPLLPQQLFIGYNALYYFAKDMGVKALSIQTIEKLGNQACARDWHKTADPNQIYQFGHCFSGAYFSTLMKDYGFSPQQRLKTAKGSWTLGVAVVLANKGAVTWVN